MKISQEVKDAAAAQNLVTEAEKGMAEKSQEFHDKGGEIYLKETRGAAE